VRSFKGSSETAGRVRAPMEAWSNFEGVKDGILLCTAVYCINYSNLSLLKFKTCSYSPNQKTPKDCS
jgi:hypothetical protein